MRKVHVPTLMLALACWPLGASIITSATAGPNSQNDGSNSSASANFTDAHYIYSASANIAASYLAVFGSTSAKLAGNPCLSIGPCQSPGSVSAGITANTSDVLIFFLPSGNGTVMFRYHIAMFADLENSGATLTFINKTYQARGAFNTSDAQTVAFKSGQPVLLFLTLNLGGTALAGPGATGGFSSQGASAGFALDSVQVFDSAQNLLTKVSYSSSSNTNYLSTDPEPATWTLIMTGALALPGFQRYGRDRKKSASSGPNTLR